MRKILLICMVILVFAPTACARRGMGKPDCLNIFCFRYMTDDIQKAYGKARTADDTMPMINFITPDRDFSDMNELYDSLMKGFLTKSPDIDLFVISGTNQYAYDIIENHYYVDLGQDEALQSHFDAMYPDIQAWCSDGGEVFGFPYHILYNMHIMADDGMMASIGYHLEDIKTMDGFLDFCDTWDERIAAPPTAGYYQRALSYCENYLLLHYDRDTGDLNLDTPAFRSILSRCRELAQLEYFQEPYGLITDVDSDTSPLYFGTVNIIPRSHRQYVPIQYPLLKGEPAGTKRYASVYWLLVNPYSKHIDQAVRVVESYAGIAGNTELIVTPVYRDPAYYDNTERYSQENLDNIASFIGDSFAGILFPGYYEVLEILDAYITDDSMTLDQAIMQSQHVLDMVRKEQYIGK